MQANVQLVRLLIVMVQVNVGQSHGLLMDSAMVKINSMVLTYYAMKAKLQIVKLVMMVLVMMADGKTVLLEQLQTV